jgi:hypothetical protein
MRSNLKELEGAAEFFDSYSSPRFIGRLASMYTDQEPGCLVVRGLSIEEKERPVDLQIGNTYPNRSGEKHSKEIARLLNERIGGNRVKTDFGNVIREVDANNPESIKIEPTHTHPDVRINDMSCLIQDGAISQVTFVDDVWKAATAEEQEAFKEHHMIEVLDGKVLWNADFVNDHDIFEKLEALSRLPDAEFARTALILGRAIRSQIREYYLVRGEMIFFAQLKTLRGAPAYKAPESGIEKRWYQSMTYA